MVVNGTISYASQESWMFPATVRENILFGLPYDDQKYKEVMFINVYDSPLQLIICT